MSDLRIVPCEACGTEGRIIRRCIGYEPGCGHPHNYGERDDGECQCCEGTGGAIIQTEPIDLDDLDVLAPSMITCPDCRGRKSLTALADGPNYRGPMLVHCHRCRGTGEVDPGTERWMRIGGTHRTWRVAQHESLRDCAGRLGVSAAKLSAMENGRADPARLLAHIPPILLATAILAPA